MPFNDKIDRCVFISLLILIPIGLVCAFVGAIVRRSCEDRLVEGGLSLALGGFMGVAAYAQIRFGVVVMRKSTWNKQCKAVDKQERPYDTGSRRSCTPSVPLCFFFFAILSLVFSS